MPLSVPRPAMPTAPTVKAAAVPQITPIKAHLNTPSVAQSTPRPTSKDTTKTIAYKSTVPAILAIPLHPPPSNGTRQRGSLTWPPFKCLPVNKVPWYRRRQAEKGHRYRKTKERTVRK
jgi:hypothetical protein